MSRGRREAISERAACRYLCRPCNPADGAEWTVTSAEITDGG